MCGATGGGACMSGAAGGACMDRRVDSARAVVAGGHGTLAMAMASINGNKDSTVHKTIASIANDDIDRMGAGSGIISRPQARSGSIHTGTRGRGSKSRAREVGPVAVDRVTIRVKGDLVTVDIDAERINEFAARPFRIFLGSVNELGRESDILRAQDDIHRKDRTVIGGDPAIERVAHGISSCTLVLTDLTSRTRTRNHINSIARS